MNKSFKYTIDSEDRITSVCQNWCEFARDNKATDQCTSPLILGRTLWDFISDMETRHIYELMVQQVRMSNKQANVTINCDSPDLKRLIEITINPLDGNSIEFSSTIVEEEERDALPILDPSVERSRELVKICSFCKKIAVSENEWLETSQAVARLGLFGQSPMPKLSHGMCPECYSNVMADMNAN